MVTEILLKQQGFKKEKPLTENLHNLLVVNFVVINKTLDKERIVKLI